MPEEPASLETRKSLTEYVEEGHQLVERAKKDGVGVGQLLLGVAGRLGLNAWDMFLLTMDPGKKA